MLSDFFKAFIPLFVAMDIVAVLPVFIGMTKGISEQRRKAVISEATVGALVLSMIFLATGQLIFKFLGISQSDFRVGGGIVLLVLAVSDLVFSDHLEERRSGGGGLGIVPIGIPLIMGPAALTTILICVDAYGYLITLVALLLNLLIVWFAFRQSKYIIKIIGEAGALAFGKVASLFIAAIAVMMIRTGIKGFL